MASLFQRGRSDVWIAAIRAWDAEAGAWRWVQKSTGTTDRAIAGGIAATLERASGAAKAGSLTRAKAVKLVNDILTLAGAEPIEDTPSLATLTRTLLESGKGGIAQATRRKYAAQWSAFEAWAGERINRSVDSWTSGEVGDYYDHCRSKFSATTANDHLRFVSMIFDRAVKLGHRASNPTAMVDRVSNDTSEKATFTRSQIAAVLRACRRAGREDWTALVGLGWHTGHRIQDLLDVTADNLDGDLLSISPRKKGGRGREVVLPLPLWLARRVARIGDFRSIHRADNRNGRVSEEFLHWLKAAGVDPLPVQRGARIVHRRTFHSLRHSMASRLVAAGVSGELARLVTDHDSPKVQRRYVHAEIQSLREALRLARRR